MPLDNKMGRLNRPVLPFVQAPTGLCFSCYKARKVVDPRGPVNMQVKRYE